MSKVFLHDDSDTLRVQTRLREVAIVGLVVDLQCKVAIGEQQVLHIEVANE